MGIKRYLELIHKQRRRKKFFGKGVEKVIV